MDEQVVLISDPLFGAIISATLSENGSVLQTEIMSSNVNYIKMELLDREENNLKTAFDGKLLTKQWQVRTNVDDIESGWAYVRLQLQDESHLFHVQLH